MINLDDKTEQITRLCLLGLTDNEIAHVFGIPTPDFLSWVNASDENGQLLKDGRVLADADVAQSLRARALGCKIIKTTVDKNGDLYELEEELPADVRACETWLKRRRPDEWGDKKEVEHSGGVNHDLSFILGNEEDDTPAPLACNP